MTFRSGVRVALLIALCADAGLVVVRAHAAALLRSASSPFAAVGEPVIPLPSGSLADGAAFAPQPGARCTLLEYRSSQCEYCLSERPVAIALARNLAHAGCALITLSPSLPELPLLVPRPRQREIVFVRPGWLEALPRLQLEPTTIVVGPGGRVLWYSIGALTPTYARAAERRLASALGAGRIPR
ncbi:MAG: hypothetical protein ACRD04_06385 [Terriglobales bacterium]